MYRCSECFSEYTERPEYCECGNDIFEEILEEDFIETEDEVKQFTQHKKTKLSKEELEELEEQEKDKRRSLVAIGVIILLALLILFVLPPYKKQKVKDSSKNVEVQQTKLPSVNSYWDNSVATLKKKDDKVSNLPLLNSKFRTISPVLREYLVAIGSEFDKNWDRAIVNGSGEVKVEFTIDKEGTLVTKRIIASTKNESLDNSVLALLSKIVAFDVPPDDYKGERIYLSFKVGKQGDSHVIYPNN